MLGTFNDETSTRNSNRPAGLRHASRAECEVYKMKQLKNDFYVLALGFIVAGIIITPANIFAPPMPPEYNNFEGMRNVT